MKRLLLTLACALVLAVPASAQSGKTPHDWLYRAFLCIHSHEGAWNANTGNGYYGGLQMDRTFMLTYGPWEVSHYGYAHNWPPWMQINVARRAYFSGRGFAPWPNTRRMCGV